MEKLEKKLSSGVISVEISEQSWNSSDLFDFAERKNPKRAFLFVSKVLGRHIPVSPAIMRQTYKDLAQQIPQDIQTPILFVGMAETAVGLAAGVFEEISKNHPESLLLLTTRNPVDGELLCQFKEEHSHATDHLIYYPKEQVQKDAINQCKSIVLIDDEITTGNTFKNLINALYQADINQFSQVLTFTLTDWSSNNLSSHIGFPTKQLALMKGNWHWEADLKAPIPIMPDVNVTKKGKATISPRQDWGRVGCTRYQDNGWIAQFRAQKNEKILVLGSGEFVYPPFLIAEHLENQGAEVYFSAITRSPIAKGCAIKSTLSFSDNYGLNIPNYCYNVADQSFDRIILCIETQAKDIDETLLSGLSAICNQLEIAVYE